MTAGTGMTAGSGMVDSGVWDDGQWVWDDSGLRDGA